MIFRTIFVSLLLCSLSHADQQDFGPHEIHYSVFNSTFLQPDIAKQYGITRGKDRMVLNVSVREKSENGQTTEKRALVKGTSSDLIRVNQLRFREITEQGAIYYLAEFPISREDTLRFRLQVQPDRNRPPHQVEFTKTLYWNE